MLRQWFATSCPRSALKLHEFIQPVKRRRFIALRQRRIVEDRIHEIIDGAAENHHRLADVQQFGRAFADDVNAQHLAGSRDER